LPWVPIAFGAGIAIYFTADREPVAWFVAAVAVGLCAVAFVLRRRKAFAAALMLAAMASGFAVAALKTARISHVVLAQPIYASFAQGFC
jgi:competence protein ComEC